MKKEIKFEYELISDINKLNPEDAALLQQARDVTERAYAPYSNFRVGAVALLKNGKTIAGTNQENASFPAGICAERTLLANAAMDYPDIPIKTLAISYHNLNPMTESDRPISPCGICRQTIREYEIRTKGNIRVILSGMTGKVIIVEKASQLLPLSFTATDMK